MAKKVSLIRSIVNQKLTAAVTMHDHIIKMQQTLRELQQVGGGFSDSIQVALLLSSLSPDYEAYIIGFQAWEAENLTISGISSILTDAWTRKRQQEISKAKAENEIATEKI